MDTLIYTLTFLSVPVISRICKCDREIDVRFRQYIRSGQFFSDRLTEPIHAVESAPFNPIYGYPQAYHLTLDLYYHGFIDTLPDHIYGHMVNIAHISVYRPTFYSTYDPRHNDKRLIIRLKLLRYASPELRDDKETVLACIWRDIYAYRYASDRLKHDRDVAMAAVRRNNRMISRVPPGVLSQEDIDDACDSIMYVEQPRHIADVDFEDRANILAIVKDILYS